MKTIIGKLATVAVALVLMAGCEEMGGGVRGADRGTHGVPRDLAGHTIVLTVLEDECAPVVPGMNTLAFAFIEGNAVEGLLIENGQVVERAPLPGWGWEWTPTSQGTATLLLTVDNTPGGPPGDEIITTVLFELTFDPGNPAVGTWVGGATTHRGEGTECTGKAYGTFSITFGPP